MKHPVDIPMTCHAWLHHAIPNVRQAMEHAWRKHGEPTTDLVRGALNLCEEAGEVAAEALDATRKPPEFPGMDPDVYNRILVDHDRNSTKALGGMVGELYQVAGYAILLAVQLQGKEKEERDKS